MDAELGDRRRSLREEFVESHGYWNGSWDALLELDEDFFVAYLRFSSVPCKSGRLDPKTRELLYLAVDAAATHLYVPGIRQHTKQALAYGSTAQEIMEVLELTSTLGIHACVVGVPILKEELEAVGQPVSRTLSAREEKIKADFEQKRGYWNPFWDALLILDAEFFQTYTEFSSVPWVSGALEPKVKELIYTAFDVSATHLFVSGLRQHIRNALGYGASREEILETIEIASMLGIHSCAEGVPILVEELRAMGSTGEAR